MRHDLQDALDEVQQETISTAAAAADPKQQSSGASRFCTKCESPPAPGGKLRYCGRCETVIYCTKHCATEDWPVHKLKCESMRRARGQALADHEAQGGRKQDFNQKQRDIASWFAAVPGLTCEIQLLAWTHRGESPFIHVSSTSQSDAGGSGVRVEMQPRSFWNEDPRFLEGHSEILGLRQQFGESSFCPNKGYLRLETMHELQGKPAFSGITWCLFDTVIIRGAAIVETLTTATKAEDLADAFKWFETAWTSDEADRQLQIIRSRSVFVHGGTIPHGSLVPVPSRALNNEVAYMIFRGLHLEFSVCLTGLRNATHLNGRQGVIRGQDPTDHERWEVRLNDGTCVSVKAIHVVHVRRGNYKRAPP